jgi:hypothetical protein
MYPLQKRLPCGALSPSDFIAIAAPRHIGLTLLPWISYQLLSQSCGQPLPCGLKLFFLGPLVHAALSVEAVEDRSLAKCVAHLMIKGSYGFFVGHRSSGSWRARTRLS